MKIVKTKLLASGIAIVMLASAMPAAAAGKGESKEAKIKRAMSAGPAQIAADATVADHDGTLLRKGTNGWTCMPSMSPDDTVPMCNDDTWMKLMHAVMSKGSFKTDRVGISYMLGGDVATNNDDPYDTTQDPGEHWVTEGPHIMLVVPDKAMLEGIPSDPDAGGPYVMFKDTPYAHIMVPTGPRKAKAKK